jgi:ribonuclease J
MLTLVITIDEGTGELQSPPEIVSKGVRGFDGGNGFSEEARDVVRSALAGVSQSTLADEGLLREHLRVEMKRFIQKRTGGRPVITPIVVRV